MLFARFRKRRSSKLNLPSRLDREVRDEIRFYLEMRVNELEEEGLDKESAWKTALDAFGDPNEMAAQAARERVGGARNGRRMELVANVINDLVFAVRTFRKRPVFFFVAVLSLGLGIGANTAIFSVVNAVLVRPFNVVEPERLVPVFTSRIGGSPYGTTSYPDYLDYRERNSVFSGLVAYTVAPMAVRGAGEPRVTWGQLVSWDYFSVLGVDLILGRGFSPDEDVLPGGTPVAVLSYSTWQDQFEADPGVLGKTVRINDHPFTVIGVTPSGFSGLVSVVEPALWAPLAMVNQALPYTPNVQSRVDPWLLLVGRLRDGVMMPEAQASLNLLAADLATEFQATNRNKGIMIHDLDAGRLMSPEAYDGASRLLALLLGVVVFVLLVSCFNVANLQLAKAAARRREIALRYSLGASRGRIVRFLLVESLLLAFVAAAIGVVFAKLGIDALRVLQPQLDVPIYIPASIDLRVLGLTALIAVISGVLFGLAPALQVLRPGQSDALKDQGHASSQARSSARLQATLVVGQVALSLVLLSGAGLLVKSLHHTLGIDPGFDLRNGLVVPVNLGYGQYDEAQGRELQTRLLDEVVSMPDVQSATMAAFLPLGITHGHHDVWVEGYEPAPDESMLVKRNKVSSNYFETMGIRVLSGRAIDERDTEDALPVAMVNETMARRFWPDMDPVGRFVVADRGVTYTVVGVFEDGRYRSLREAPESYLVVPQSQSEPSERVNLVVRSRGDPGVLVPPLVAKLQDLAPELPPTTIQTMSQYLTHSSGDARGAALVVGIFGALALLIASVGLFGVMSYSVSLRTREFGVRLALGATRASVVKLVLGSGLRTTLIGIGVGVVLASLATQALTGLLYNVGTLDPMVFTLVPAGLLVIGQLASYLPARYAAKADPVTVLRAE